MAGDEKSTEPLLTEKPPPPSAAPSGAAAPKGDGAADADDAAAAKDDTADVSSGGGAEPVGGEGAPESSSASAGPASAEDAKDDEKAAAAALEEVKGEAKDGYGEALPGRAGGDANGEAKDGYGEDGGVGGGGVSFAEDSLSLDGSSLGRSPRTPPYRYRPGPCSPRMLHPIPHTSCLAPRASCLTAYTAYRVRLAESSLGIQNVNYVGPHEYSAPWISGEVRIGQAFEGGKLGDEAYSSTR